MGGLIVAIAAVAREALKLFNTTAARKHVDAIAEIEKSLLKEESRGYHSDDAKIEQLYKELEIELTAFKNEIALAAAKSS